MCCVLARPALRQAAGSRCARALAQASHGRWERTRHDRGLVLVDAASTRAWDRAHTVMSPAIGTG